MQKKLGINTNELHYKLLQVPKKDKEKSHFMPLFQGSCQIDLQYWNDDQGYKYLLVCVDTVNGHIDFEALKNKTPKDVIDGLDKIFSRTYIYNPKMYPSNIQCDSGAEFKNKTFEDWCEKRNIGLRFGRVGRTKQQAYVESANLLISQLLAIKTTLDQKKMNARNTKANQRQWIKHLPKLRVILNEGEGKNPRLIKQFMQFHNINAKTLLPIGTTVYVINEEPYDVNNNKLKGRFRTGDYRFEKQARKIEGYYYLPNGNPLRYIVSGYDNVTFSRDELVVGKKPKKEEE